ncbi:hypothetical protein B4U84_12600 [Westiellopsis prolifica IICB1]|nr:hypothetical protein B4U84_12600 [Westiellopsis prolifica IICB1]
MLDILVQILIVSSLSIFNLWGKGDRGSGIGDRGLGIGDWGSGIGERGKMKGERGKGRQWIII